MADHPAPIPLDEAAPRADARAGTAAARSTDGAPWTLAVLALSQLVVVLDATIVNIALPRAQQDLGFAAVERPWVIVTYALAFGSLLLLGGRVADRIGHRRAYLVGLLGFGIASALAGASSDLAQLLVGRAAQGVFAALLTPATLALLTTTFVEPHRRARAFGVFGAVASGGGAVGLILGGLLTEETSWRWCLLINVPLVAIAVAGTLLVIRPTARSGTPGGLDLVGALLVSVGLAALVLALSWAGTEGWTAPGTLGAGGAGAVFLAAFVVAESRVDRPLLPLPLLLHRTRGGACLAIALVVAALFSVFLFLAYDLQVLRGYSPLAAGVAFLPLPLGIACASVLVVPRVLPRTGPRVPIVVGALLGIAALLLLGSRTPASDHLDSVGPALLLLGLGTGSVFGAVLNAATAGVEPRDAGVAGALVNASQQVGGAMGTAVLASVAAAVGRSSGAAGPAAELAGSDGAFRTSAGLLAVVVVTALFLLPSGSTVHHPTTSITGRTR